MSNVNILNYKELDINDIEFTNPIKVKGGSYVSVPKYNGEPIYIQTPRLLNKGLSKNDQRCSIELELDNTHLNFYEFITNIDDFNIIEIQKNSMQWFKQEFPLDVVEEFYKSPVKMARSKNAPSLKIKIPLLKGSVDCNIYNIANKLINYTQVKDNSKALTVLHFYGLRFLKQQVVCEWVPVQIKVFQEDIIGQENNYIIDDSLLTDAEHDQDSNIQEDSEQTSVLGLDSNNQEDLEQTSVLDDEDSNNLEQTSVLDIESKLDDIELNNQEDSKPDDIELNIDDEELNNQAEAKPDDIELNIDEEELNNQEEAKPDDIESNIDDEELNNQEDSNNLEQTSVLDDLELNNQEEAKPDDLELNIDEEEFNIDDEAKEHDENNDFLVDLGINLNDLEKIDINKNNYEDILKEKEKRISFLEKTINSFYNKIQSDDC
jgi:hypothetical protein